MFRRIDKDLSTLNDRANCCQEREKTLVMEVQKDRDQQWKLVHCLEALEQREQDREIRIALQEDQIQMLQREVDELQGRYHWGQGLVYWASKLQVNCEEMEKEPTHLPTQHVLSKFAIY